jgi:hypothetical protein
LYRVSAKKAKPEREMSNLLNTALAFASYRMPVFPLRPGAKEPHGELVPHGAHDATTDPAKIEHWWSLSPSANIGVALPRMVVIDRDDRKNGDVALAHCRSVTGRYRAAGAA